MLLFSFQLRPYRVLPKLKGTYRYLIICWICRLTSNRKTRVSSRSHQIFRYYHRLRQPNINCHPPYHDACPRLGVVKSVVEAEWANSLVKKKRINQYMTRTGQNTGISNIRNQVQINPIRIARVAECQNLNSGSRRIKGRNSSSCFVGRADPASPSSKPSSCVRDGSNFGCKKARKRLRR
jgi:hypothetical protein